MTTSNEIIVEEVDNALYVPLECIHTEDSLTFAYKKVGAGIVKQEVQLGLINENEVIIEVGIKIDDKVYLATPEETQDLVVERLPEVRQPV
jgi:hypothetical protein